MPRTPRQGLFFLLGLWLALIGVDPLGAPWAFAADPELAHLESQLHRAVNRFRRSQRLIPLERRAELDAVARRHSEDMARRHYFSHRSPEGANWVDRLEQGGIHGFALAGENLAMTRQSDPVRRVLEGWERSPAHRRNLRTRPYNATGVGIARASDGSLYMTQLYLSFPR